MLLNTAGLTKRRISGLGLLSFFNTMATACYCRFHPTCPFPLTALYQDDTQVNGIVGFSDFPFLSTVPRMHTYCPKYDTLIYCSARQPRGALQPAPLLFASVSLWPSPGLDILPDTQLAVVFIAALQSMQTPTASATTRATVVASGVMGVHAAGRLTSDYTSRPIWGQLPLCIPS